MKLLHQINLAFGAVLIVVLGTAALLIHFVLLDHFIGSQKQELRTMGASIASSLEVTQAQASFSSTGMAAVRPTDTMKPDLSIGSIGKSPLIATARDNSGSSETGAKTYRPQPRSTVLTAADVQAIVTDPSGKIVTDSVALPSGMAASFVPAELQGVRLSSQSAQAMQATMTLKELWTGADSRYMVQVNEVPQGTLTLLAPMSKVKALEKALFGRLLFVLAGGGVLVLLLSLFITKKLIRPLMELREELKKVKQRQFAEVRLIRAGGEIGSVARTVHELAGELDRYNRVQKQFFQNASHELKTPLMSIAGYAEGIRDGVFEGEGSRRGLDIILSESGRLKKLVSEMTLLAKLDSEEDIFRSAPVPLRELVDEARERMNPMLMKKGLKLVVEAGPDAAEALTVEADKDKLLQALLNIVANAARHARSIITIRIESDSKGIQLTVADDGSGFPESLLPQLFHRFVKGKDGDTGLGLAISRAIVERSGGFIRAGNQASGGAVISMGFPPSG
ncbi:MULTISPECIES: HAMP domain-containing sensor histidine kinase [unclassified Paenibacillus]|uniref:sensor histidine kinase n=1 Tax=unclassified Paenibacillus TaxID=185978 RepID=UPI0009545F18|nr:MULTISPECIES: HAMP domain-containing sensor histidine kinase [unclassified Paenibacillus]ASS66585.1 HAMP domain-containing histidine kinase [Paenibacillus sp. RUD330]SIQ01713.1 Signal transduction histidine kinase [Paenibacillus sp. RU4X]SIQ20999.1 Signal transduction histidine kinase [Paenibacillus sp. RU4T]